MRIQRVSTSERDIADIADHLGNENPNLGLRFLDAVNETAQKLANMPEMGGLFETGDDDLSAIRVWPIAGFKSYLIFYKPIDDGIKIYRILHGSRDLSAILKRHQN